LTSCELSPNNVGMCTITFYTLHVMYNIDIRGTFFLWLAAVRKTLSLYLVVIAHSNCTIKMY
jgi:hypothetical protein